MASINVVETRPSSLDRSGKRGEKNIYRFSTPMLCKVMKSPKKRLYFWVIWEKSKSGTYTLKRLYTKVK